jgi:hypothetical protein
VRSACRIYPRAERASLVIQVEISSEYPVRPPFFRLRLKASPKAPTTPAAGLALIESGRAHKLTGRRDGADPKCEIQTHRDASDANESNLS